MGEFRASIIIPARGNWQYTRACLDALAATVPLDSTQVIVVDNASSDATLEACPPYGRKLFGKAFRFFHVSRNINFGPASNLGAKKAAGEYLVFLNNDTVPQPGWLQTLLGDFEQFANIGAAGPLLLYPQDGPLGRAVQHLGICITPFFNVRHLYEGMPAASPLVRRRRFFQAITAACMAVRRDIFYNAGMFDEAFANGLEDVDLCARLGASGLRMTVNPEAVVWHYQGLTSGRRDSEEANARRFKQKTMPLLRPDWQEHLRADGLEAGVNEWLELQAMPPAKQRRAASLRGPGQAGLGELLVAEPFTREAWPLFASRAGEDRLQINASWFRLFPGPAAALDALEHAIDAEQQKIWFHTAVPYCRFENYYETKAKTGARECAALGQHDLARGYADWLGRKGEFFKKDYKPFMEKIFAVAARLDFPLHPFSGWAYAAWSANVDQPRRAKITAPAQGAAFSILMPVYNPEPEHLRAAIESVLAQDYDRWQLCIADDASTDAAVRAILEEYQARDARINVMWRAKNGHIAAASNDALTLARNEWIALLDQDDLLAPDALRLAAATIAANPGAILVYSDEDKIHESGMFFNPCFKGRWDWELLPTQNFVSHLGIYRADRMRAIGGFREGYRGSQDYDLLLRYITAEPSERFAHIPHVLYHWRAHSGSTAMSLEAKPEALASAKKAVQAWLKATRCQAALKRLPGTAINRLCWPDSGALPAASIICDAAGHAQIERVFVKAVLAAGAREIILLDPPPHCPGAGMPQTYALQTGSGNLARRLNAALAAATGEIVGLLWPALMPRGTDWLKEFAASLARPEIGACAGKIIRNGALLHGGYLIGADGELGALFKGQDAAKPYWYGWTLRARTIAAADELCLFAKKSALKTIDGFDPGAGAAAVLDCCARLGRAGLRVIWQPAAEFDMAGPLPNLLRAERAFRQLWHGRLPVDNAALIVKKGDWRLYADCQGEELLWPSPSRN